MSDQIFDAGPEQKNRIIVVAGASSTLGSHLARFYHSNDLHVRAVDIKPPKHGAHRYYAESLIGNLCDLEFCKHIVRGAEIVLQCARVKSTVHVSGSDDDDAIIYRTNHHIIQNLLASSSQAGVKTFFYASRPDTPQLQPLNNHFLGTIPPTCFGVGTRKLSDLEKLHAEQLALAYSNRMVIRISRLCNLYGPTYSWEEINDDGPITLIRRILAAKHLVDIGTRPRLQISGDPERQRQFVYINDAVKAITSLIKNEQVVDPFIVLSSQPIPNIELAKVTLGVARSNLSAVDITYDGGVDPIPNLDSISHSSKPLKLYEAGLTQLRNWIELKIQAALLNKGPEDHQNYLMSLLSRTTPVHITGNPVKFAIIIPLPSQAETNRIFDNLETLARSLKDTSWRDRNELGATRHELCIYLIVDIEDKSLFPSSTQTEFRLESIFHENGFSRVFLIPYCTQQGSPGIALGFAARRAYADHCDYYCAVKHNTEIVDEGWMRLVHAKYQDISVNFGGPSGFGCVAFAGLTYLGLPVFPVIHRTHLDIFEGQLAPDELDGQHAAVYLFQLYHHFGASATIPIRAQGSFAIIRDDKKSPPDWNFDAFEDSKDRIRVWAEQNSPNIRPRMSLDIIIPSYRVPLERLSRVLALKPSPSCITTFIIVVDNPRSHYVYELKHSHSHRTDVRILINESNQGASASRNRGLSASTAEWVAFLDDDVDPSPNYLVVAEKYIRDQPNAAGFVGNTYFPPAHSIYTAAIQLSGVTFFWDIADKIVENVPWGITANLIVRRNVHDQVQFDPRFPKTGGGEDIDFCINQRKASLKKNGTGFSAAPGVTVTHPWWNNGHRLYSRFFNWARGDGALIKMHPDLSWRDSTLNSAETLLLAALSIFTGVLFFSRSMIRFGVILAISNFSAHVLHDAHRHLVRQKAQPNATRKFLG